MAVFAKEPAPGQVKTRLAPPLSNQQAADLYREMLADVLAETARAAERFGFAAFLVVHPPDALGEMLANAPAGFAGLSQRGPDLGARLAAAIGELFQAGYGPVLVRGSDSPGVSADALGQAIQGLTAADVVIAPDRDGGYHLLGSNRLVPGLFDRPMSQPRVFDGTVDHARSQGCRVAILEPGYDVDTVEDLARLRAPDSQPQAGRSVAFATREDLWRFLPGRAAHSSRSD